MHDQIDDDRFSRSGKLINCRHALKLLPTALLALAACGSPASPASSAASSAVASSVAASQAAATAPVQATAAASSPGPAALPADPTVQEVGSEIIRWGLQHKASIANYSIFVPDVTNPSGNCVTLYSDRALAEVAQSKGVQLPAAANDPGGLVSACATGNLQAGDAHVTSIGSSDLTAPAGPNDFLSIAYALVEGKWILIARAGSNESVHPVQLSAPQVAQDVSKAFAVVQEGIAARR